MGVKSIVDQIEEIFSNGENFDESGFVYANLVTPELAETLGHLEDKDLRKLYRLGYGFSWFNEEKTDGILFKPYGERSKKIRYVRRLYYDQVYPFDNAKEERNND